MIAKINTSKALSSEDTERNVTPESLGLRLPGVTGT